MSDDAVLKVEISRVHKQHYDVYGARKVWWQLERQGFDVGRDRVTRPMAELGTIGMFPRPLTLSVDLGVR